MNLAQKLHLVLFEKIDPSQFSYTTRQNWAWYWIEPDGNIEEMEGGGHMDYYFIREAVADILAGGDRDIKRLLSDYFYDKIQDKETIQAIENMLPDDFDINSPEIYRILEKAGYVRVSYAEKGGHATYNLEFDVNTARALRNAREFINGVSRDPENDTVSVDALNLAELLAPRNVWEGPAEVFAKEGLHWKFTKRRDPEEEERKEEEARERQEKERLAAREATPAKYVIPRSDYGNMVEKFGHRKAQEMYISGEIKFEDDL
jgi:hypothetical protein